MNAVANDPASPDDARHVSSDGPVQQLALFRQEAIDIHQAQWLGPVVLAPRPSHAYFTIFGGLAVVALGSLLFFGHYTHRARVNGWLAPEAGIARVMAPGAGTVTSMDVTEGTHVTKGQKLLVLSTDTRGETGGATREEVARRLRLRRDSMIADREREREVHENRTKDLAQRAELMRAEASHLATEIDLQRAHVASAEKSKARWTQIVAAQLGTIDRQESAEENLFEQNIRLRDLERTRDSLSRDLESVESELGDEPLQRQLQFATSDRSIAEIEQEILENEALRTFLVTAPTDGTATAILIQQGGSVSANMPLLSVVPDGSKLEAQLFAPSRAIGFVRPGEQVRIRYQAFPYEKFGTYLGTVTSVSGASVSPAELPPGLAGLSSIVGEGEAIYRIDVALERQSVTGQGRELQLRPGAQLEADVLLERRRLVEWMLDPLLSRSER